MESLVAAYASSSESSDASSVSSDFESSTASKLHGEENEQIGTNSHEPQWKRAFPHVNGNWPSHVRVNVPVDMKLRELAWNAIKRAQEIVGDMVPLVAFEELRLDKCSATGENDVLHLSLSRPFVLTYDQINLFVDSLRAALKWRQRFSVTLRRTLVLVNDDKTRSFLALRAVEGESDFVKVLHCVDQCLTRFKQPTYYKNPIPHISIASSMGEDLAQLTMDQCESLLTPQPEKRQTQFLTIDVTAVHVAIGNKHYNIPLR